MQLLRKNVDLNPPLKLSSWRKVAIGTWKTAADPSVYAIIEVDVQPALQYIEEISVKTGEKLTLTHFMGKAMSIVLEKHPAINCILRIGRLYPRKSIDIFFQVSNDSDGKDLSGTIIRQANLKSMVQIAQEMKTKVKEIREKGDPGFKKMKTQMGMIPGIFVGPLMNLVGFILYTLNIWSPLLGSPRDPFGSVMVTSIGSLGLKTAFAPIVPYSRVPLLIAVGAIQDKAVVKNGKIEISQISNICATFDHRLIDGLHGSKMAKTLEQICADPHHYLGSHPM